MSVLATQQWGRTGRPPGDTRSGLGPLGARWGCQGPAAGAACQSETTAARTSAGARVWGLGPGAVQAPELPPSPRVPHPHPGCRRPAAGPSPCPEPPRDSPFSSPAAPSRAWQPWLLASGLKTAVLVHKNHFLFSSSIQKVLGKERAFLQRAGRTSPFLSQSRPPPTPLPAPSPSWGPRGAAPAACSWRVGPGGFPPHLAHARPWGRGGSTQQGRGPSPPPEARQEGAHPSPALPSTRGRVGGRPGPPEGSQGGPRLGNGVWEGGIYRLLFTKTRPCKTFNSSQLKGAAAWSHRPPGRHSRVPAPPTRLLPPRPLLSRLPEPRVIWEASAPAVSPRTPGRRLSGLSPRPAGIGWGRGQALVPPSPKAGPGVGRTPG